MDPNNNVPPETPITSVTPPPDMSQVPIVDKKRLFIMVGVMIVVAIIISIVIMISSGGKKPVASTPGNNSGSEKKGVVNLPGTKVAIPPSANSTPVPGTNTTISPSQAPSVLIGVAPEVVAKTFYDWYVNHAEPLASEDFKERPEITEHYKNVMQRYVNKGLKSTYDPVFNCGNPNLPKNITALPAEFDINNAKAHVILQETSSKISLFQIKLVNTNKSWFVDDVWCAP